MGNTSVEYKPSILFTNLFLAARSGSELHVLELAKAFLAKGWDVTCFSLVRAYPLQDLFAQVGIKVIRYGEEDQLADHYSVLYAQHHIVSDYLWDCTSITFDKVIVASLGPLAEHEKLPSFSQVASLQVFVSYETLEHNQITNSKIPALVFPNSVDKPWFDNAPRKDLPKTPKRIAIISNHIAQELLDYMELAGNNCHIDCYGYEGRSIEITLSLITSYDLIISIGRTVPLCFAARTPVYCYDVHGGPGYIGPDSVERDSFFNFSGRSNPRKLNALELLDDITSNYESATYRLEALYQYACNHLDFTENFEKLYRAISTTSQAPAHVGVGNRQCTELTKINRRNQCEAFIDGYSKTPGIAQLFFSANGEAASEANSVTFPYCYHTDIDASNLIQGHVSDGACIRFDPDIHPVTCAISGSSSISPLNRERSTQNGDLFLTNDPIYLGEIQELRFCSTPLSEADYCLEYSRLKADGEEKGRLITYLRNEIDQAKQQIREHEEPLRKKILRRVKHGL